MAADLGEDTVMALSDPELVKPLMSERHSQIQPPPNSDPAEAQSFLEGSTEIPQSDEVPYPKADTSASTESTEISKGSSPGYSIDIAEDVDHKRFSIEAPKIVDRPSVVIYPQPKLRELPYSTMQSGIVFDARMRFHTEIAGFDDDYHPEDPRRILEIFAELKSAGLVADPNRPTPDDQFRLWHIVAREATIEEICYVHTLQHFEWVQSLCFRSDEDLVIEAARKDSIYMNQLTFFSAKLSAGGTIEACDAIVAGRVRNAVAVVRPPGHHAEREKPGGFCFFDNVAIAARYCQKNHPETCRKILILDWDVHHGNGVQQAFYDDPNVLYVSVHVHMNGTFYPAGDYGDHKHCGEGAGLGYNVNIPWRTNGMGDGDYLYAFQKVIMPIAQEFDPDFVIVAAGFDAADGDDLGGCFVSPAGYAHMTHMLMSLANGKIAVVLEGGYNLRSIAKSALAVTRTLVGEPPDRLADSRSLVPSTTGVDTVHQVIRQQSRFWKRLFPQDAGSILKDRIGGIATADRMDEVVRRYQYSTLWEKHQMRPLPILHETYGKAYEKQVLVTSNYDDAVPLLVILHDPPEMIGTPDARTGKLDLHNVWLADPTKLYVDQAIQNGFAVMDVNIPKHFTIPDGSPDYVESEDRDARATAARELCLYLWQNYICPNNAEYLFFLGIGDAYLGLIHLLSSDEYLKDATDFIYAFVADHTLQSVRRAGDADGGALTDWYRRHSMVIVSPEHAVWDPSRQRKASKKYGRLFKSPHAELGEMLAAHRGDVMEHMLKRTEGWRDAQARRVEGGGVNGVSVGGQTGSDGLGGGPGQGGDVSMGDAVQTHGQASNGHGPASTRQHGSYLLVEQPPPGPVRMTGTEGLGDGAIKLPPVGSFAV